jgi:hypothetical protein
MALARQMSGNDVPSLRALWRLLVVEKHQQPQPLS